MDPYALLTRGTSEVITEEEARTLITRKFTGYIGFEPSGIPHIALGLLWPRKIAEIVDAGCEMTVYLADWHAMVNDKLGRDMGRIRASGRIFERVMRRMGVPDGVKFIWASDVLDDPEYWKMLLNVAKNSSLKRLVRALPIMGRSETDANLDFSKYIYPLMQVTDIFFLEFDLALGGMDQRHAHMLARDIADKMGMKKVVAIHSPLISSLKGRGRMDPVSDPSAIKMSKSDVSSGIFMFDSPDEIRRKISASFCPAQTIAENPVADILKLVILPRYPQGITISRPEGKGGPIHVSDEAAFSQMYSSGGIHPADLKTTVADYLVELLEPMKALGEELRSDIDTVLSR
jgi:tyrosyl-tRNA synthetase